MNGKFSKWNKRITAWLLLLVGFYMGIMDYSIEMVVLFLGSGLAAIGLSIWHSVKAEISKPKRRNLGDPGHPPPGDDDDDD